MNSTTITGKRHALVGTTLMVLALLLMNAESRADSGFYVGGSVGTAGIELDVDSSLTENFDEDDFAWKAFAGYSFPVPVVHLAVEAGYVDLGAPSGDVAGTQFEVDADGLAGFGVLGIDLGPIGVFAKYGIISWDAEFSSNGLDGSDDGSDPAYGLGASFGIASFDIRAEYEIFDIEDSEDVSMISVGLVWTF